MEDTRETSSNLNNFKNWSSIIEFEFSCLNISSKVLTYNSVPAWFQRTEGPDPILQNHPRVTSRYLTMDSGMLLTSLGI